MQAAAIGMLSNIARTQAEAACQILSRGRTHDTLVELVANAHAWSDQLATETFAPVTRSDLQRVSCKAGCSWCCHQVVGTTGAEALHIAAFLRNSLTADALAATRHRIVRADDRSRGLDRKQRAELRMSCPLLEDDRCMVHAQRPLACRGEHSFDATECRSVYEAADHTTRLVERNAWLKDIPTSALSGLIDGIERSGLEGGRLELNAALVFATEEASETRWLSGERVFSEARLVERDTFVLIP
jgi:hypothetical protein